MVFLAARKMFLERTKMIHFVLLDEFYCRHGAEAVFHFMVTSLQSPGWDIYIHHHSILYAWSGVNRRRRMRHPSSVRTSVARICPVVTIFASSGTLPALQLTR